MKVIAAWGTRPEAVKIRPVIDALRKRGVEVMEWCSGQSKDLVDGGCAIRWDDGIHEGIGETIPVFAFYLRERGPFDCVIVQGDTATAFACAQAAFLARIPVAHVEAGLRTYASEPWPEEAFRRQIAAVARWHFCPDGEASGNIYNECGIRHMMEPEGGDNAAETWYWRGTKVPDGLDDRIFVVGNTVIDTLPEQHFTVLVTLHRRENWGERIANALRTLQEFANAECDARILVIRHPNWSAHLDERQIPGESRRFRFEAPMERDDLLDEIQAASVVVTDSGGLQEEAAHHGIPCLVLRTATERVALERTGAVTLVHPDDPKALQGHLEALLSKRRCYGSGDAGERIAEILTRELNSLDTNTREA